MTPAPDAAPLDTIEPGRRSTMLIGSERAGLSDELLGAGHTGAHPDGDRRRLAQRCGSDRGGLLRTRALR